MAEWPEYRRWLESTGAKTPKQCDDIETHAVNVFRDVRDAIAIAIDTNNPLVMSQPRLLDRLKHAHAFAALHADPASLVAYERMIYPAMDALPKSVRPEKGDFMQSLWEGKWNEPGNQMPADVTRRETHRISLSHKNDGLYNTRGRLDPVTTVGELDSLFPATEPDVTRTARFSSHSKGIAIKPFLHTQHG